MARGSNANRRKRQGARSVAPPSNASTTTLVQQQPRPYTVKDDSAPAPSESTPSRTTQEPTPKKQPTPKETPASPIPSPPPNVFEYLDEDDSSESESDSDSDSSADEEPPQKRRANPPSPLRNLPLVKTTDDRTEAKSSRQSSFNSNSGISMRDRSPGRASSVASRDSTDDQPATPPNASLSPLEWKFAEGNRPMFSPQIIGAYNSYAPSILEGDNSDNGDPFDISVPETFYLPREKVAKAASPPISPRDRTRKDSIQSRRSEPNRGSPRTFEQRPRKLSLQQTSEDTIVPPVYRKFETLNHRILLNLQNEIAEMEEDLKKLDELEAMHRAAATRTPTRRRSSASSPQIDAPSFSTLHFQKQELLEQVQTKIQQYNRALSSYSKVVQTLPHASHNDIETYRTWVQEQYPASKAGSRYLNHDYDPDLVSLSVRPAPRWTTAPIHSTITAVFIAILLPLLAFGTISEFFGRLVLVSIVGAAASFFANTGPAGVEHFIDPQDGWKVAAVYFGFMTVSAMIIP
ncbi:hypothetical protein FQN54_004881 [Arachnomyces sp. PD_36]|nr:hypothetical protein FQN54_004881 [Arachnomyces sp. PD_36]